MDQSLFFSAPGGDFQNVLDEDMAPFEKILETLHNFMIFVDFS